jgi:hypothetical protein
VPAAEGKAERHIKVVASSPEHPKLVVRTRTNYVFAADQAGSSEKASQ